MRFKQAFSCNADIGDMNGTGASGRHIYDPNVRPSQWAVWSAPAMRRIAPAGAIFPWRGRHAAGLLSHMPIPDEMQPDQRFTCFSSHLFSGKIGSTRTIAAPS
ncbi:hypothetical protein [Bradyrhizobium sp.]|uniref:hypothetical protein n=1 Tax=Bradyrhizobium sp. TaxID=376 RepID=UPI0027367D8D|nr:hypothetical protein [Bradyrhizobium sp.]MDP3078833.1 hypothetical protein [Bradyrhizobium sp.]